MYKIYVDLLSKAKSILKCNTSDLLIVIKTGNPHGIPSHDTFKGCDLKTPKPIVFLGNFGDYGYVFLYFQKLNRP
jgi:hypothetical protein